MTNLLNLDAETGANMIGDDAQPTLSFSNTSTGPGIKVDSLVVTGSATIASMNLAAGDFVGSTLTVNSAIKAAKATIVAITLRGASVASGAIFKFTTDALVSVSTIQAITGGVAGTQVLRIVKADGTFGWIPVYPDAAVTASAV